MNLPFCGWALGQVIDSSGPTGWLGLHPGQGGYCLDHKCFLNGPLLLTLTPLLTFSSDISSPTNCPQLNVPPSSYFVVSCCSFTFVLHTFVTSNAQASCSTWSHAQTLPNSLTRLSLSCTACTTSCSHHSWLLATTFAQATTSLLTSNSLLIGLSF